jgi:hypothetical protein
LPSGLRKESSWTERERGDARAHTRAALSKVCEDECGGADRALESGGEASRNLRRRLTLFGRAAERVRV